MSDQEWLKMFNHPIWEYCTTVSDLVNGGYKVVLSRGYIPTHIVEDWKAKYGDLPYEQR